MLVRVCLFTSLLPLFACGKSNISFVGVNKLQKEAKQMFDIKVKVTSIKDTENNTYYLELSHVKGKNQYFGGIVAVKPITEEGIIAVNDVYFKKECSSDCFLTAEVFVRPTNCKFRSSGGRCSESSESKARIPITVTPTPWHMEVSATKQGNFEVSLSKNGQPAAGVVAKIIACTDSGSSVRRMDNKTPYYYCRDSDSSWMPSSVNVELKLGNDLRGESKPWDDGLAYSLPHWEYDTFGRGVQEITFNKEGRWTSKAKEYVNLSYICETRVYVEVEKRVLAEKTKCPSEEGA